MKRWYWKRWAWAGVFGATAAVGLALAQPGGKEAPPGPPKVGDTITLPFQDGTQVQVKVLKTEKQPDGSYHSEVKNLKTGETFTLVDRPPDAAPAGKGRAKMPPIVPPDATGIPKAKQRATDPLLPSVKTPMPETPRDRVPANAAGKAGPGAGAAAMPDPEPEPPKRRGLLSRIFGKKSAPADRDRDRDAAMPTVPVTNNPNPAPPLAPGVVRPGAVMPSATRPGPAMPPAVRPTPGATGPAAPPPVPSQTGGGIGEPPRVRPAKPVAPPIATPPAPAAVPRTPAEPVRLPPLPSGSAPVAPPATATPSSVPVVPPAPVATPPSVPVVPSVPPAPVVPPPSGPGVPPAPVATPPVPAPVATPPLPAAPSIPAVPAIPSVPATPVPVPGTPPAVPGGLPMIPVPPGGTSMSHAPAVVPAAHASTEAAIPQDAQPHAAALQTGAAPSLRATAAHALATGPHRSSDAVRAAIFRACEKDPSPFVRACCIDELAKLGYEDAKFLAYLDKAAADPSDDVKMSAKLAKLRRSAKK